MTFSTARLVTVSLEKFLVLTSNYVLVLLPLMVKPAAEDCSARSLIFRPTLVNIRETNRLRILKIFINYINFVNESVNNRIDVNEVEFILNLDN